MPDRHDENYNYGESFGAALTDREKEEAAQRQKNHQCENQADVVDVAALRALAELATEGPWFWNESLGIAAKCPEGCEPDRVECGVDLVRIDTFTGSLGHDQGYANHDHIIAANPSAILEVLNRLTAAEAERDKWRDIWGPDYEKVKQALTASEKRAGEYRIMILKFLAMEREGYLMVDAATRAAWIEEAKALADPQHGGTGAPAHG